MSRDSSGNYTLPLPDVVTGNAIEATWANTTLADIESEITNSLSRNGKGGMNVPLKNVDGTVSAPAVTFNSEAGSGLYRAGSGDVRMAVGGVDFVRYSTANGFQYYDGSAWHDVVYGDAGSVNNSTMRWDTTAGQWEEVTAHKVDSSGNVTCVGITASGNIGCVDLTASGDVGCVDLTASGNVAATGTVTGSNLSGTNTGDEAAASYSVAGVIEIASQAEVDAGVSESLAVTPYTLANYSGWDEYTVSTSAPVAQSEPDGHVWYVVAA